MVTKNASNVVINNITVEVHNCLVGAGQGVTSIRDFSNNINVTNSLFYSNCTIGVSTLVCAGAQNILIENNTVRAEGYCGNVVYFTTYNLDEYASNENITLKNNLIDHSKAMSQNICIPLVLQGSNHKIINNTLLFNGTHHDIYPADYSVMAQMVSDDEGVMVYDDDDLSGNLFINNNMEGPVSLSNALVVGNTFEKVYSRNCQVYNNTIGQVNLVGNSTLIGNDVDVINYTDGSYNLQENNYVDFLINGTVSSLNDNTKWILINKSNINDFSEINDYNVTVDYSKLGNNSNILFDLNNSEMKYLFLDNIHNKNLKFRSSSLKGIIINNSEVSITKSDLTRTLLSINDSDIVFINSSLLNYCSNNSQVNIVNTTVIANDEDIIISKSNKYFNFNEYENYFDRNTNKLLDSVSHNSNLIFVDLEESNFSQPMIINKAINMSGIKNTELNSEITFTVGSEGSNITNLIINCPINVNNSSINIINNKIYNKITIQNSEKNMIKDNLIVCEEIPVTLLNANNTIITNNNITTNATYTIQANDNSKQNKITDNSLITKTDISSSTVGVNSQYNIITNNYPKNDVKIDFQINDTNIRNIPTSINITVNSNGVPVEIGRVIITSNSIKKAEVPLNNGKAETEIKLDEIGQNIIRVHYISDDIYSNNNATKKVTVNEIKSNITLNVNNNRLYENTTFTATVIDEYGNSINEGNITFKINDYFYSTPVMDGKAIINMSVPEEYVTQTLYVTYSGSDSIENSSLSYIILNWKGKSITALTYITEDKNTTITATVINTIGNKINAGYVQFAGKGISKLVKIENNKAILSIPAPTEEITINATFRNNQIYDSSNSSITIVPKKDVLITYDINDPVTLGENVTIVGKFTDLNGKIISSSNVKIIVNGVKSYAKTDNAGVYMFSAKTTVMGINNVSIGYSGNDKYNAFEVNTTFTVGKQDVIVTCEDVEEVSAGTNVTITGRFTTNLGKAISSSNVRVFVNGVKYLAKTDKNGIYSLSVLVTQVGVNNLSVGYAGNVKYNAYEVNSTFTVGKQDVIVTYNKISNVNKGDNVTITGKFTDNLGKAITNSNVKITINGKKYYAKTDSTGKYTLSVETTKEGVNNVTIGYSGSAKYNAYETSTTFTVLKAQ